MENEQNRNENEARSSITLKKNAKGEYQWDIKVYAEDPMKIPEIVKALNNDLERSYGTPQLPMENHNDN
jgi:hypothetical protein